MRRHPPQKGLCTMCQEVKLISGAKERCDDCQIKVRRESFMAQKKKPIKFPKGRPYDPKLCIFKFGDEEFPAIAGDIKCGKAYETAKLYKCYCGEACFKKDHEQNIEPVADTRED